MVLETPRLVLVSIDQPVIGAAAAGDAALAHHLAAALDPTWPPEFWTDAVPWLAADPGRLAAAPGWWAWIWLLVDPDGRRTLIGNGGFKGPPDERGSVEIGYSIVTARQRLGLATEACRALLDHAFADQRVTRVAARTLPGNEPSIGVAHRLGMTRQPREDSDGEIAFAIVRSAYRSAHTPPPSTLHP